MSNIIIDQIDNPAIRKSIVRLAWPAILRLFLQTLVQIVDVIMIAQLGAAAIAAVDVSNRLVMVLIGTLTAMTVGTTALVGHYTGAGEKDKANSIMWQSLLGGAFGAGVLALVGALFSPQILQGMMMLMEETEPLILSDGSVYLRIVLTSMLFGIPMMIINAVLQGLGDMKTPMYIMVTTNLVNVSLNYFLIFGIGPFPAMGVSGAALATGLARVVGAAIGLIVLMHGRAGVQITRQVVTLRPDHAILRDILRIGVPAAVEQLIRQSSQIIYTILIAGLGTLALAANAIVMNILSLSFMPGFGFSVAVTTLVAQSLGAKREDLAERYGAQACFLGSLLMSLFGLFFLFFAPQLAAVYAEDPVVQTDIVRNLRIVALVQPLLGLTMIMAGALRGAGDTKWVMYITAAGSWGVRLAASYILAFTFGLGLTGFWLAFALDVAIRSVFILQRHRSGLWKHVGIVRVKTKASMQATR